MKKLHDFSEVFDGQKVFRKLLEALSNPGRTVSIAEQAEKMYGDNKVFLALAMTVLDNEVSFCACGNKELAENISLLTLSKELALEEADFIFVEKEDQLAEVFEKAKCGTLADPQKSATIMIKTEKNKEKTWNIYGAGVDGTLALTVPNAAYEAMELRDVQHYEYPQGVDMVFVTDYGELFAIPRLVLRKEEQ